MRGTIVCQIGSEQVGIEFGQVQGVEPEPYEAKIDQHSSQNGTCFCQKRLKTYLSWSSLQAWCLLTYTAYYLLGAII